MIYKHQYFVLNTESRKVFDENNKELRLAGNAYRMLVFLCENKDSDLTDIGTHLDWAKEYTENHLRQYKYRINTIIGYDIVEYRNNIYSIVGKLEETNKLEDDNCNTDLLQQDSVELNKKNMNEEKEIKFISAPAIFSIVLLLLTFLNWPYAYYTFLRLVITGVAIYYLIYLYKLEKTQFFWILGLIIITILFNPIVPIHLGDKSVWGIIDVIVSLFFVGLIVKFNKK